MSHLLFELLEDPGSSSKRRHKATAAGFVGLAHSKRVGPWKAILVTT